MECPRCGLANMPGSRVCFQCGVDFTSPVEVPPAVAEDYYPVRAKKPGSVGASYRREAAPLPAERRTWRRSRAGEVVGFWQQNRKHIGRATASLIPGLGQFLNGQAVKGLLFAAGTAGLAAMIASSIHTLAADYLAWTLGSIIWSSVMDAGLNSALLAARPATRASRPRLTAAMALISFSIVGGAYAALMLGTHILFARARLQMRVGSFVPGDTILLHRFPGLLLRGDCVFAHVAGAFGTEFGERRVEELGGDSLATVLAVPGDTVEAVRGKLSINSYDQDPTSLGGAKVEDSQMTVPAGSYFCLLRLVLADGARRLVLHERLGLVPATEIIGRPVAIVDPPPHRRWLPRVPGTTE